MIIQRWTVADPARMSVVPAQEGDLVTYADHLAAMAGARIEWGMSNGPALDFARGYAAALAEAREAVVSQHAALSREERYDNAGGFCEALAAIDALQTSLSGPAVVRTSEPEPPTSVAPAGEDHGAPADPPFRFSRSVECIHQFKTFDQIDGGKHAKCVLCGFKEPAAHVKPIYVDAWDGMAVPYDDHVVAVETAHAAGMREALADFLTSIDEDDPVYLRGHARGIQYGMRIGRVMAARDIEQLGVWAVNPNAYIRLTDGTRLVRLNDAVKAARGEVDA